MLFHFKSICLNLVLLGSLRERKLNVWRNVVAIVKEDVER